jgi:hypothetical protein
MSMKKSNDTIGNQTRDLPACSAVPQPTAPLRAPNGSALYIHKNLKAMIKMSVENSVLDGGFGRFKM